MNKLKILPSKLFHKIKESFHRFLIGESSKFVLFLILLGGIFLIFFPLLFTKINLVDLGQEKPGEIGDIINGVTAPFIGFGGIIVTFYAFWIQFKANIALRKDFEFSKFENKYYELLRLHRANVEEMELANIHKGRKVFVHMYRELVYIYFNILKQYQANLTFESIKEKKIRTFENDENLREWLCNIAYKIFFYGIGDESNKTIALLIDNLDKIFVIPTIADLKYEQSRFLEWQQKRSKIENQDPIVVEFYEMNRSRIPLYFESSIKLNDGKTFTLETRYYPFDGHSSKLSHYYRHLFQAVKFIAEDKSLEAVQKENYMRTIRAQLSNHEQLMLYYNALSDFGKRWLEKDRNYLVDYRLIHNIPIPLADIGRKPKEMFAKEVKDWRNKRTGNQFFEWDEFTNTNN